MKKQNTIKTTDNKKDFSRYVDQFKGKKICVIGDIIADVYIFGKPYRLSREAPVVVVKYEEAKIYPGSAGNTINNLLALGAYVYPTRFHRKRQHRKQTHGLFLAIQKCGHKRHYQI